MANAGSPSDFSQKSRFSVLTKNRGFWERNWVWQEVSILGTDKKDHYLLGEKGIQLKQLDYSLSVL